MFLNNWIVSVYSGKLYSPHIPDPANKVLVYIYFGIANWAQPLAPLSNILCCVIIALSSNWNLNKGHNGAISGVFVKIFSKKLKNNYDASTCPPFWIGM